MNDLALKRRRAQRRLWSVRATLRQTASRPRLSVHRTTKHIYAQVIDDVAGKTVASSGSSSKGFSTEHAEKTKTEQARLVGEMVAKAAVDAGVSEVVFDRGASRYHGRVKALAEAAREAGLKF